jgi:predicted PurR-regulated permease PerM
MGNILAALFSITFISYFFLSDQGLFFKVLLLAFPTHIEPRVKGALHKIVQLLSRYFTGLIIESSIITCIISFGLYLVGIENFILIGFFVGLVNIIPYVGPLLGLFFGLMVAVTTTIDTSILDYSIITPIIIKVASIIIGTQIVDATIMQPFIFSKSVKAHPLEIFLVILMAGTLAGVPGMILAVPVYTIFRVVGKEFLSEFDIIQKLTKRI